MRRVVAMLLVTLSALSLTSTPAVAVGPSPAVKKLVVVGKIAIPRLRVKATIYKGVTDVQFDRGVGFWPGTALPGTNGNVVIGGHRTAAKRPFYNIQKMKKGDLISLSRPGHTFTYRVTKVLIVRPTDVWIVEPTSKATLTLFTCHPRGNTSKRYVVRATLVK